MTTTTTCTGIIRQLGERIFLTTMECLSLSLYSRSVWNGFSRRNDAASLPLVPYWTIDHGQQCMEGKKKNLPWIFIRSTCCPLPLQGVTITLQERYWRFLFLYVVVCCVWFILFTISAMVLTIFVACLELVFPPQLITLTHTHTQLGWRWTPLEIQLWWMLCGCHLTALSTCPGASRLDKPLFRVDGRRPWWHSSTCRGRLKLLKWSHIPWSGYLSTPSSSVLCCLICSIRGHIYNISSL